MKNKKKLYYYIFCGENGMEEMFEKGEIETGKLYMLKINFNSKKGKIIQNFKEVKELKDKWKKQKTGERA